MTVAELESLFQSLGKDPKDLYKNYITELGDEIVNEFKKGIDQNTKRGSGTLKQSVTAIPSKKSFEVEADFYYKFIDDGVKPIGQKGVYAFKDTKVPKAFAQSIREWSGKSIEQSYAIAVSIKKHGIEAKNITDKVMNSEMIKRIENDLLTLTGLVIEVNFDNATKQ